MRSEETQLLLACAAGNAAAAKGWIERGADVAAKTEEGVCAMMLAVKCSRADCVRVLCEAGAAVEGCVSSGRSLLAEADCACAEVLLERGADPNAKGKDGLSPLHCAAKGDAEKVKLLLGAGADVEARNQDGQTALMVSCWHACAESVRALLDGRSDPNARDHGGGRGLMMAAWVGSEEIAAMLLKAGARVDEVDDRKWSALMMAAERGHAKCLAWLAACGADLALVSDTGETSEQIARRKGWRECAGILSTQSDKAKIASGIGADAVVRSRVGLRI